MGVTAMLRAAGRFRRCRLGVAVEMDALVRAIPAGDVAQVAADAFLGIDARHDLVIQIQVLPLRRRWASERPRKSSSVAKPFSSIQLDRPSIMSSTMRKP